MKKFSQIITEAFDNPYSVSVKKQGKKYVGDVKLPDKSKLKIKFVPDMLDDQSWDISFLRGDSIDLTGEGDAMRIFATVLDATRQFLKMESPKEITFAAYKGEGNSRANLYKRLVSRFATSMEYKVAKIIDEDDEAIFYLRKVKKSKK